MIKHTLLCFILLTIILNAQNTNSLEQKMESYSQKVKTQWKYNPLRNPETDKYFSGYADINNYNTKFWFGTIFNANKLYNNKNFTIDKVIIFHSPTLSTELAPIAFNINEETHRIRIGVAYSAKFNFAHYQYKYDKLYGTSFLFSTYMQVEAYFDYIFKNKLKIRFAPLKHVCYHMGGDILGDDSLHNKIDDEFIDVGFEQMHIAAYYRWGWFSFYGGTLFAITGFKKSNLVNIFTIYAGSDFRFPLWGEMNLIAGFYVAGEYDEFNRIDRKATGEGYNAIESIYKWSPSVSVALGLEIYRFAIGIKYEYLRSRQLYAFKKMESKIGLEASLFF
ncbi:hypothetical protein [Brachyspira pilosicoli]|uniref:hypothetical protein n=1 Tax=Brachyspira pilosicoli TaxID=52584 RepID=UPI0012F4EBB2|nr:hypothetical protein [Brachyspira pilosicoli]